MFRQFKEALDKSIAEEQERQKQRIHTASPSSNSRPQSVSGANSSVAKCNESTSVLVASDSLLRIANFVCGLDDCAAAFSHKRDLLRHQASSRHRNHNTNDSYQCACGKQALRRDHHRRHLQCCKGAMENTVIPYQCSGGHAFTNKGDYLNHLNSCRVRKPVPPVRNPTEHEESMGSIESGGADGEIPSCLASKFPAPITDSGYGSYSTDLRRDTLVGLHGASVSSEPLGSNACLGQEELDAYSDTSSVFTSGRRNAILEIAQEIVSIIRPKLQKEQLRTVSDNLPETLDDFAFRLGREGSGAVYQRLMYLFHRYKVQITNVVMESLDEEKDEPVRFDDSMSMDEKMSLWESKHNTDDIHADDRNSWVPDPDAFGDSEDDPVLQEYKNIIFNSSAYSWLRNAVNGIFELAVDGETNLHQELRQTISTSITRELQVRISSRRETPRQTVRFRSRWIYDFLKSQEYIMPWSNILPHIIVFTGSINAPWASTCEEYLNTVWPEYGSPVLKIFQELLDNQYGDVYCCTLFDDTEISAYIRGTKSYEIDVAVTGVSQSIAEIGLILTWISSIMSASINADRTTCIRPGCTPERPGTSAHEEVSRHGRKHDLSFTISKGNETCVPMGTGRCWMNLFGNPVIVTGFKTPRRNVPAPAGLQISLSMMVALARARKISNFGGKLMIKGFSTALVPTGKTSGCITWHVVTSYDAGYLSFTDSRIRWHLKEYPDGLTISDLRFSRHVVGWCTEARCYAGSPTANYSIDWSGLMKPHPGCTLEKATFGGSQFVTAGVTFAIGKKDKPPHIRSRDDYTIRLKRITKKFVVLYDVLERKAWLVDGISALLHLVRTSLKHDATDDFRAQFLFQESSLQEAPSHLNGKDAAIYVLTNLENIALPLYPQSGSLREEINSSPAGTQASFITTKTNYCLKDRIEDICDSLETIMDHQIGVTSQDGVELRLKSTTHRQLEGFEFMDIATDEDPFWPRVTTLRSGGKGWVDFTRSIQAVTLFGSGFGELIGPAKGRLSCSACNYNVEMPKSCDYLAVGVADIKEIAKKRGNKNTNPMRLVDSIYWHAPDLPFDNCHCTKKAKPTGADTSADRIQVLLPATFPKLWARGLRTPQFLPPQGALLFGHSKRFPLRWRDKGDPEIGQPDDLVVELDAAFTDSGIGTSQGTSSSGATSGNSPPSSVPDGDNDNSLVHPKNDAQVERLVYNDHHTEEGPSRKRRKLFGTFLGLGE